MPSSFSTPFRDIIPVLLLLLLPLLSTAQVLYPFGMTTAGEAVPAGDNYGFAIASSGNLMVVGAYLDDAPSAPVSNNQGAAYLLDCSSFPCTDLTKLTASDGTAGDLFGRSVTILGTTVIVGAPYDVINGKTSAGSAYIFDCSSIPCTQVIRLNSSDAAASDFFGWSVATNGNLVAIGAQRADTNGVIDQGAVYVYDCSSSPACHLITKLNGMGGLAAYFGFSLAMEGNWLLVGASDAKPGASYYQGAVFIYECTTSGCTLRLNLTASDGVGSDRFGVDVAISGDMVVVGARGANSNKGAAYVFQCTPAFSCTQKAKLVAPDGASGDYFGFTVTISNQVIAVGAFSADYNSSMTDSGAAYLFDCQDFVCTYLTKMAASDPSQSDYLGWSVAMIGWKVAAAAYGDDVAVVDQGSVKLFDPTDAICGCSPTGSSSSVCGLDRQCSCNAGWAGQKCNIDVDECALNIDNCDAAATCTNTLGSFTCACNAGYSGDGVSCSDDDECALNTDNCDADATCTNTLGSFTCACNAGYSGDGTSCSDVNECTSGTNNCDAHATCTNTLGSFTCACNAGYDGDGHSCIANPYACLPAASTFHVTSSWPNGFQATLSVTTPVALYGWKIYFDLPAGSVSGLWNGDWAATSVSGASSSYVVISPPWNAIKPANAVISLGMTGSGSALPPTSVTFCPLPAPALPPAPAPSGCSAATYSFNVGGSWSNGFQATLSVTTPVALYGWTIYFDLPGGSVASLWSGQWAATSSASSYAVISPSWNAIYAANSVIQLGMTANGNGATVRPTTVLFCPVAAPTKS